LQLNASDDRGIDVVREKIVDFAGTKKLFSSGVKLIILDEADAMTNDAQFALRRVIEKYTRNARFCILCNYVSKIIPALQSRCTRFRFAPLKIEDIRSRLTYVGEKEGLGGRLTPDGANAILRLANGDMRKVLNVLQATASGFETVDEDAVYSCTGSPRPADMREILASLLKKTFEESYKGKEKKHNTNIRIFHALSTALPVPCNHPNVFACRSSWFLTQGLCAVRHCDRVREAIAGAKISAGSSNHFTGQTSGRGVRGHGPIRMPTTPVSLCAYLLQISTRPGHV
jgi:replication factor C subunit 3/5